MLLSSIYNWKKQEGISTLPKLTFSNSKSHLSISQIHPRDPPQERFTLLWLSTIFPGTENLNPHVIGSSRTFLHVVNQVSCASSYTESLITLKWQQWSERTILNSFSPIVYLRMESSWKEMVLQSSFFKLFQQMKGSLLWEEKSTASLSCLPLSRHTV